MASPTVPGPTTTIHGGPGFDLYADRGPRIMAVNVALIVLSGIAVLLRFMSRILSRAGLWWDDWMILCALVWDSVLDCFDVGTYIWIVHIMGSLYLYDCRYVLLVQSRSRFRWSLTYILSLSDT